MEKERPRGRCASVEEATTKVVPVVFLDGSYNLVVLPDVVGRHVLRVWIESSLLLNKRRRSTYKPCPTIEASYVSVYDRRDTPYG